MMGVDSNSDQKCTINNVHSRAAVTRPRVVILVSMSTDGIQRDTPYRSKTGKASNVTNL